MSEMNAKETVGDISDEMRRLLTDHIGRSITPEETKSIVEDIQGVETRHGRVSTTTKVEVLYDSMSRKERVKWFIANRLLKWVGRETRRYHRKVASEIPGGSDVRIPSWAEECPKEVLIVSSCFTPGIPADSIRMTVEIPPDKEG